MRETPLYRYYAFGYNYHGLRSFGEGFRVHGESRSLVDDIDGFLATLRELELQVTIVAAGELWRIRERADAMPKDAKADATLASEVRDAVERSMRRSTLNYRSSRPLFLLQSALRLRA